MSEELKKAVATLKRYHDSKLLKIHCDFCVNPAKYQLNGVPTEFLHEAESIRLAIETVVTELEHRAQPDNSPLSLDELRQMDGEPVWCGWMNVWAIVYIDGASEIEFTYYDGSQNTFKELEECYGKYSKTWLAYRRKPEPPQKGEKE